MKSAFECLQRAAKCEAWAKSSRDHHNEASLRQAAEHWRALGEHAKRAEPAQASARLPLKPTGD
jgi:hypothetical protein